jgi:hypothetical protein
MRSRTAGLFDTGPIGADDLGGLVEGDEGKIVLAAEILHDGCGGAEGRGQGFAPPGTAPIEHD